MQCVNVINLFIDDLLWIVDQPKISCRIFLREKCSNHRSNPIRPGVFDMSLFIFPKLSNLHYTFNISVLHNLISIVINSDSRNIDFTVSCLYELQLCQLSFRVFSPSVHHSGLKHQKAHPAAFQLPPSLCLHYLKLNYWYISSSKTRVFILNYNS